MVLSRRRFLTLAGLTVGGVALGGCASPFTSSSPITPDDPLVAATEAVRRAGRGRVRDVTVAAEPVEIELAGRRVTTWAYNGQVPGPEIRLRAGEVLRARLDNRLADPTTIHWHGIALRNDMDGVPGVTQAPVDAGASFTYEFTAPDPGTYFFHPHVGVQLDRGLYAALVIDDPDEPGAYDREVTLVLDDWTDGVGEDPDAILARLLAGGGMGGSEMEGMQGTEMEGMDHGGMGVGRGGSPLGGDPGDVDYPLYVINGRPPEDPFVIQAKPGERVRLRLINAGSDTAFRVALSGHRLRVTHTDGFPVTPVEVDTLLIGMGERYDVVATLGDGVFSLVASAEGKDARGVAVVRAGGGAAPAVDAPVAELGGRMLAPGDLVAAESVRLPPGAPDRVHRLVLESDMARYRWTINGRVFDERESLEMAGGQRVRLVFDNRSTMFHPMHVHGHTFQVGTGPRKDTVNVLPGERVEVELEGDNPGQWVIHCHNIYHAEAGMTTTLSYVGNGVPGPPSGRTARRPGSAEYRRNRSAGSAIVSYNTS